MGPWSTSSTRTYTGSRRPGRPAIEGWTIRSSPWHFLHSCLQCLARNRHFFGLGRMYPDHLPPCPPPGSWGQRQELAWAGVSHVTVIGQTHTQSLGVPDSLQAVPST